MNPPPVQGTMEVHSFGDSMRLFPSILSKTLTSAMGLALGLALPLTLAQPASAQSKPAAPAPSVASSAAPQVASATPSASSKPRVRFQTSMGPFVVELEPEIAPKTVANFLTYVKEGYYTNTIFHRVIQGYVVQGGGLLANLSEKPGAHSTIFNEARTAMASGLKNVAGTLAMARTEGPHTAQSQFFINTVDNPSLDPRDATSEGYGYCVFGRVVEGMDNVTRIEKVQTVWRHGMSSVPEYPVYIKGAECLPASDAPASAPAPAPASTPASTPVSTKAPAPAESTKKP
jgi:cyclophilin family peptidyl-prolyl cis-trans isomerase